MLSKAIPLVAALLVATLVFTGCAAESAPAEPAAVETPAPTPEPTAKPGDVLTAEQVEQLKASGEIIAGYPVGDQLIAVKWGKPISENVRQAANTAVNAAAPEYGTSTDHKINAVHWTTLRDAMNTEAEKLGGVALIAVACVQSFSTTTNSYRPTWVISEPGPVGEYGSYQEAYETAEAWMGGRQTGKRMYVLINNLGCAQQ